MKLAFSQWANFEAARDDSSMNLKNISVLRLSPKGRQFYVAMACYGAPSELHWFPSSLWYYIFIQDKNAKVYYKYRGLSWECLLLVGIPSRQT